MGLRIRQSFQLFPGVRLNLSTGGVSVTLGVPGASVNLSNKGPRVSVGLPGTGISYSTSLTNTGDRRPAPGGSASESDDTTSAPTWVPGSWGGAVQRYKSGPTAALTSSCLRDLRELMCSNQVQREDALRALAASEEFVETLTTEQRGKSNFLWAWAFRRRLNEIKELIDEEVQEAKRIQEWIGGPGVSVEVDPDPAIKQATNLLMESLERAKSSVAIWDLTTSQGVELKERSAATSKVDRKKTSISTKRTNWVGSGQSGVKFENANGDPLVFYPGFLLVDGGDRVGPALIAYADLSVGFDIVQFLETEKVPSDCQIISRTWAKVNKDGSPDRRFKENYQIPVVQYGQISLRSKSGLHEVFMFSSVDRGLSLAASLTLLRLAYSDRSKFDTMVKDLEKAGADRGKLLGVFTGFALS
jgi:hypothetical protein